MEFVIASGDHSGIAVHILKLYFVLADAAHSILRGCRGVQGVVSEVPRGRLPGKMVALEIRVNNSHVRVRLAVPQIH